MQFVRFLLMWTFLLIGCGAVIALIWAALFILTQAGQRFGELGVVAVLIFAGTGIAAWSASKSGQ